MKLILPGMCQFRKQEVVDLLYQRCFVISYKCRSPLSSNLTDFQVAALYQNSVNVHI